MPAGAINRGVALSQAPFVGIMIDGARIATPGIVDLALQGLQRFERAVVGTVGFHLGPDAQMYSLRHGYNQTVEDQLLADIEWPRHGYRLFDIGALAGSSPRAWLGTINSGCPAAWASKSCLTGCGGNLQISPSQISLT